MLSSVFKFRLQEISSSPILKDLVRSFEISAPCPLHHLPPWDLDKVLEYLSGPPFWALADASSRNKTRKALFLIAMATATRVGELQALILSVSSGRWSGSPLWPFFLAKQNRCRNPSQINHSPVSVKLVGDLPERVLCPVRIVCYLRWAARSVEFTPSRLFVSPSDPTRTLSKNAMSFFLRQIITESGAVSSLVQQEPMTSKGLLLLWIIFKPFHFCHHRGSYMEVFSCVCHEIPYRHVYHLITTLRYGSSDRCGLCCPLALSDGSLCFVLFSLYCYGFMSGIFTYEQFPFKSHPVLTLPWPFRSRWTLLLHVVLYGCV